MFGKTVFAVTALFVFAMPIWAQYQSDDEVININDGEIIVSADDFYRHLEGAAASSGTDGEVDLSSFGAVLDFSEDIVKARSLVAEAKKQGCPDDDTADKIRKMSNNQLRDATIKNIKNLIEVPEDKIEEFYAGTDTSLKVAIIIVEDEAVSRGIYDELVSGSDFGDIAAEKNINDQLKESRGDIPQPIRYSFDPTVKAAFDLGEPGGFTEPMEIPTGNWLIVNVIERTEVYTEENPKPELETLRESIAGQYIDFRSRDFITETVDNGLAQVEVWRDEDLYQNGLSWHKDKVIDELHGKGLVLARVGDDELTFDSWWPISEFESLTDEEWEERRNSPDGDEVVKYLERRYNDELSETRLLAWGKTKGIDKDADFAWDIWRKSSETILNNFTDTKLLPLLPTPSDEEVRANFDGHKDEYFEKESLNGRLYAFPSEEEANSYRAIADEYIPENNLAPDTLIQKIVEDYGLKSEDGKPTEEVDDFYITYRASREPEIERKFTPEISDELADSILGIAFDVESHVYSPVHLLANGRYAFFWNRYFKPFRMKEFDEVEDKIYRELNDKFVGAPETTEIVDSWIQDITSKYDYVINEETARAIYDKWQADNPIE